MLALVQLASRRRSVHFQDRVVLIFGGSRGLGLVLARELAAQGARLALAARDEDELERAKAELRDRASVVVISCDVRVRAEVEGAVARTVEHYGRLDVLVNDAGIIQIAPVEHAAVADFEDALATHFWGPLYAVLAALPHLRRSDTRRIINIASVGGLIAVPHLLPYSASKFALVGLSEGLHTELAREGIVVTTVSPGLMRTGSTYNAMVKGQHRREFAWFHLAASIPGLSMDARRAARNILEASRRGRAHLVLTAPARLAAFMHTALPGTTARMLRAANRLLPGAAGSTGDRAQPGWESTSWIAPSPITFLADRATLQNNEIRD